MNRRTGKTETVMKRLFMTTLVMLTLSVSFASCGTDDTEFAPNTGVPAPPANNDDNSSSGGGSDNPGGGNDNPGGKMCIRDRPVSVNFSREIQDGLHSAIGKDY